MVALDGGHRPAGDDQPRLVTGRRQIALHERHALVAQRGAVLDERLGRVAVADDGVGMAGVNERRLQDDGVAQLADRVERGLRPKATSVSGTATPASSRCRNSASRSASSRVVAARLTTTVPPAASNAASVARSLVATARSSASAGSWLRRKREAQRRRRDERCRLPTRREGFQQQALLHARPFREQGDGVLTVSGGHVGDPINRAGRTSCALANGRNGLLSPILFLSRREAEAEGLKREDLQLGAAIGALHDLAGHHVGQLQVGGAFWAFGAHGRGSFLNLNGSNDDVSLVN